MSLPTLYSFRRCPYAIRARLAMATAGIRYRHREILLKSKPDEMLAASPKGTVPVLILAEQVIDESIQIMRWAVLSASSQSASQSDLAAYLKPDFEHPLLIENDQQFKPRLDRYKYFDRYPEHPQQAYLQQTLPYLQKLETAIADGTLRNEKPTCLDHAIFPFIRQFAFVDKPVFDDLALPKLQQWLAYHLDSPVFNRVMEKYPLWEHSQPDLIVDFADSPTSN